MKTETITEVKLHTRPIPCPVHFGEHKVILYRWPHRYAGIWECLESGVSDVHDHSDSMVVETITEDHLGISGHYETERKIYVCSLDGVAIELDVADPKTEEQS